MSVHSELSLALASGETAPPLSSLVLSARARRLSREIDAFLVDVERQREELDAMAADLDRERIESRSFDLSRT